MTFPSSISSLCCTSHHQATYRDHHRSSREVHQFIKMPESSTIHTRHAASTLHNSARGTAAFKNAHKLKDSKAIGFQDIPSTHAAHRTSRSSKYFSTGQPIWTRSLLAEDMRLAHHPSNLQAVWGIDQVRDPEVARKDISCLLLPGLAE